MQVVPMESSILLHLLFLLGKISSHVNNNGLVEIIIIDVQLLQPKLHI